jgi:hypothetical protein
MKNNCRHRNDSQLFVLIYGQFLNDIPDKLMLEIIYKIKKDIAIKKEYLLVVEIFVILYLGDCSNITNVKNKLISFIVKELTCDYMKCSFAETTHGPLKFMVQWSSYLSTECIVGDVKKKNIGV